MRKPKTTHQLFYDWAHQFDLEGRVGNVRYRGATLCSYAEPIAYIVDSNTVLHSRERFSMTTNRHQSLARSASCHMRAIFCPVIPSGGNIAHVHVLNDQAWRRRVARLMQELTDHPRRKLSVGGKITMILNERQTYAEHFGLVWENDLEALRAEFAEEAREAERRAEEAQKLRAAQIAAEIEEEKADLAEWREGAHKRRYFHVTALRVKGDEVQTTRGASIPLADALKLWRVLWAWKMRGERVSFIETGTTLMFGNFKFTSFEADGTLVVGCHTIPWTEIEYVAERLELRKEAA